MKRLSFPFASYWFNVIFNKDKIESSRFSLKPEFKPFFEEEKNLFVRRIAAGLEEYLLTGQFRSDEFQLNLGIYPPFFRRVYAELMKLPPGQTITYKELASRAGSPNAARAVGQAMMRNRHQLFIPCHRVVGARWIGGWSGIPGLKEFLLFLESKQRRV